MNHKKILAIALSVATLLPQAQCMNTGAVAGSKFEANVSNKELSEKDKIGIGIGGGGLLTVAGVLVVGKIIHHKRKKSCVQKEKNPGILKEQTRKMCENMDWYVKQNDIISLHYVLPHAYEEVSACYYGKDAFKNLVSDTQIRAGGTNVSCEHSTCIIRKDVGKCVFGEPGRELYKSALTHRFVQMCTVSWKEASEDKLNEFIYKLADANYLTASEKGEEKEKSKYNYLHFRPTYGLRHNGNYVIVRVHKVKNTVEWKFIDKFYGTARGNWAPLNYDSGNDVWSAKDINVSGDRK